MAQYLADDRRRYDLADHFVECNKLGGHLTVMDDSRFIITDDFTQRRLDEPSATAVASICSKDPLVALAALVPLSQTAVYGDTRTQDKYEELFSLIEETALNPKVKDSAAGMLEAGFKEARIRELERELGAYLTPARKRYRAFLGIVRQLTENKVTPELFKDEFLDFTYSVAGRLDFGIYSFCLDRIFLHPQVHLRAKRLIAEEITGFPPLIRKELLVNILVGTGQLPEFTDFVRRLIAARLDAKTATEIRLLQTLKLSRQSINRIEGRAPESGPEAMDAVARAAAG